ncbi:MAG: hypothetical protein R6V46_00550 [Desulfatiglandaceae bacterium]
MFDRRGSVIDRRSGKDRRKIDDVEYFSNGGGERRCEEERRSHFERRWDWIRVSQWFSVCPWERPRV